ncbi:unnamed protein product [Owenia fusiformis]|uniref:Uncharacterized protein n=1 Tax=Owenia fusiformis TaxID=6347 RepID=A0A8J1Y0T6_OWEFU|nr:unnamed protein product [Owenia fusiformis]
MGNIKRVPVCKTTDRSKRSIIMSNKPTKAEIEEWFAQKESSGEKISGAEIGELLSAQGYSDEDIKAIADHAKMDASTQLTQDEFIDFIIGLAVLNHMAARIRKKIRREIRKRGGKLTPEEVMEVGPILGKDFKEDVAKGILEKLAKDGEGKINGEEFVKQYTEAVSPKK